MEQRDIQALLKPSAYPEPTQTVTLVQTHVSFLFLTDSFVYKIKKPVDLGFLNFTTLDRRRFYCEEEVRLNRRLCPDVYLGVVKLRESSDGVTFSNNGQIVDYAVKMRRLPDERMLHRLLQENKVDEADIREIARTIAEFHKDAESNKEIEQYGGLETIINNWDENFRQVADFVGLTLEQNDLELIQEWVNSFFSMHGNLFAERISGGFIRDCDGDIHAENICLSDRVYIFDCIEFNNRFRYIDTAADIAFLAMDFDYHNKRKFADIFVEEYIAASDDAGLVKVLEFYKIYRAFVRGKVECFRLNDRQMPPDEKDIAKEKAKRHFRLASGYILRRRLTPSLIVFSGLMGTGKTTLASELAFELGLDIARSDVVRKEIALIPENEHPLYGYGEGIYTEDYSHATYERLLKTSEETLESGRTMVIDASFSRKLDRKLFRSLAQRLAVPFFIILTTCPDELAYRRLNSRLKSRDNASDGRWELFYLQKAEFEEIDVDEGRLITLDTIRPIVENINKIMRFLEIR
jgi:aminoglycoside phosphotransferase family enzyme/predicted kinase